MGLNIKNAEAERLIEELAALTGETKTEAVARAVRERIEQERRKRGRAGLAKTLLEIGQRTAPLFKEPFKSVEHGDLLYDEKGLPK
ncbi:type II toxin-antitoxin system VapB family antitoxin [Ferrovibrio sp.]|uniref:type II toxin-antitoxin system VapB family antitoxin n=1 Tax=Ferrovibrio sp. TaxID=1917215 RepID=UPI00261F804A|nr:type II toxin-antitoxin system VapB family antitoxin [Ferrovibrio sp.]